VAHYAAHLEGLDHELAAEKSAAVLNQLHLGFFRGGVRLTIVKIERLFAQVDRLALLQLAKTEVVSATLGF